MNYSLSLGQLCKNSSSWHPCMADALTIIADCATCLPLWNHVFSCLQLSIFSTRLGIFFKWFWNFRQHFPGLGTGRCFSTCIIYKRFFQKATIHLNSHTYFLWNVIQYYFYENMSISSRKAGHWSMILLKYNSHYKCDYEVYSENTGSAKIICTQLCISMLH